MDVVHAENRKGSEISSTVVSLSEAQPSCRSKPSHIQCKPCTSQSQECSPSSEPCCLGSGAHSPRGIGPRSPVGLNLRRINIFGASQTTHSGTHRKLDVARMSHSPVKRNELHRAEWDDAVHNNPFPLGIMPQELDYKEQIRSQVRREAEADHAANSAHGSPTGSPTTKRLSPQARELKRLEAGLWSQLDKVQAEELDAIHMKLPPHLQAILHELLVQRRDAAAVRHRVPPPWAPTEPAKERVDPRDSCNSSTAATAAPSSLPSPNPSPSTHKWAQSGTELARSSGMRRPQSLPIIARHAASSPRLERSGGWRRRSDGVSAHQVGVRTPCGSVPGTQAKRLGRALLLAG